MSCLGVTVDFFELRFMAIPSGDEGTFKTCHFSAIVCVFLLVWVSVVRRVGFFDLAALAL